MRIRWYFCVVFLISRLWPVSPFSHTIHPVHHNHFLCNSLPFPSLPCRSCSKCNASTCVFMDKFCEDQCRSHYIFRIRQQPYLARFGPVVSFEFRLFRFRVQNKRRKTNTKIMSGRTGRTQFIIALVCLIAEPKISSGNDVYQVEVTSTANTDCVSTQAQG